MLMAPSSDLASPLLTLTSECTAFSSSFERVLIRPLSLRSFFTLVDRILRRSLGVSESAPTDTTVKPAPPVDPELPANANEPELDPVEKAGRGKISWEVEEVDELGNPIKQVPVEMKKHDEL